MASVKIINAALDETPEGDIILRGVVCPDSLCMLQVDHYQREVLSSDKVKALKKALEAGNSVPDIVVGMRGEKFFEREDNFYLQDDVYIIDGLQRVTAALQMMGSESERRPHLGVKIHFNTSEPTERKMFESLNLGQTRLNGNIILRNKRVEVQVMEALYNLTHAKGFVLNGQVSWTQNMRRGDLITAMTFVKVAAMLHSHTGPGRSNEVLGLVSGLEKIRENVGRGIFVSNVRTFFEVVDKCWGIQRVAYRQGASYLKTTFLLELARVLSDHTNFWNGGRLEVDGATIKKLQAFAISDPMVMQLASASGTAGEMLNKLFVDHINSGRRTRRLKPRRSFRDTPSDVEVDELGSDAEAA